MLSIKLQLKGKNLVNSFFERKGKIMTVLGIVFAMVVAACAEYGARTNMKDFA